MLLASWLVPKMMMYNQEEILEDAYILGGMWYLNNWVLTSRMSKDQWKDSAEIVGHGKSGQMFPGLRMASCPSKVSHTEWTKLSQNLNLNLVINIIGVKGAAVSRKRSRGCSGGWRTGFHGVVSTRTRQMTAKR